MLGAKIDARLNLLERKLVDLTHRLERLEKPVELKVTEQTFGPIEVPVVVLPLEPKRRGRPPKAKNG